MSMPEETPRAAASGRESGHAHEGQDLALAGERRKRFGPEFIPLNLSAPFIRRPVATTLLTMTGVFATVNGVVLSFAQNSQIGFGMSADLASVVFLTPFALIGWLVGPFAGRLAPTLGYRRVLRFGLVGTAVVMAVIALVGVHSLPVLIACTALLGVTYAGGANIILNGLGVVLSPKGNPGFLPGMNAGAFNLGSGLSFAVLPAVEVAGGSGAESSAGYVTAILAGVVIVAAAFAVSFLIPR